jgi:subfamily B ATP-binding cassette protein MsbA
VLLVALTAASTLLGLVAVWPVAILVDSVLVPDSPPLWWLDALLPAAWVGNRIAQVAALAAGLLFLRICQELLSAWRGLLTVQVTHDGLMRLRCDLFGKLQILSLRYHLKQPQGDTIHRLTSDTQGHGQVVTLLTDLASAVFTLVMMLAFMLARSVELTLVAMAVVPPLLAVNFYFAETLSRQSREARRREGDLTSTVQRSVAAVGLVQLFGRQSDEFRRCREHTSGCLNAWDGLRRQMALYRVCVGLIFGLAAAGLFAYGGYLVHQAQLAGTSGAATGGLTAGSLMVFLTYLGMFYDPLCRISGAGASLSTARASLERVFEVLDQTCVVEDAPDAIPLPVAPRTVRLENVSFEYEPGKPVLRNVTAVIEPGQSAAFVGTSGAGKSTLLNLLSRLYEPTSGRVMLDEHDVGRIRLADLRRHVAVVLQESVILPTTVAENINYGRPEAGIDEIRRAAELAGAAEFIEELPNGYETMLSENGSNLSGGQRQRIAIARALLTEAPVIVLDEPTSALDPEHERQITETLRRLRGLRTVIVVSHRLTTVADCDRIFVMREGRIISDGTHAELMAAPGWYAEMARQMYGSRTAERAA